MKFLGITIGAPKPKLNSEQQGLKSALFPLFQEASTRGYGRLELGKSLEDHFNRTRETITTERTIALLQKPEALILEFRQVNNKNNRLTGAQTRVLAKLITNPTLRDDIANWLAKSYVVDALSPIKFKEMVTVLGATRCQPTPAQLAAWKTE